MKINCNETHQHYIKYLVFMYKLSYLMYIQFKNNLYLIKYIRGVSMPFTVLWLKWIVVIFNWFEKKTNFLKLFPFISNLKYEHWKLHLLFIELFHTASNLNLVTCLNSLHFFKKEIVKLFSKIYIFFFFKYRWKHFYTS